jgi:CBS domain-containing protein
MPIISAPYPSTDRFPPGSVVVTLDLVQLAEILRPSFIEVAPEDTLGEVAERMTAKNVGAVVVKDFGRLIGILTERDLLKAMAARVHSSEARVRQWMTEDPITVTAETDAEEAARVMLDHGFRHLPVLDEEGRVLGLVSLRRVVAAARPAPDPA